MLGLGRQKTNAVAVFDEGVLERPRIKFDDEDLQTFAAGNCRSPQALAGLWATFFASLLA